MMLRCGLLLCYFLASLLSAEANNPLSMDMYADREQADIGDEIVLTVTYTWPKDFIVDKEPNPADVFNQHDLFIVDAPPVERLSSAGQEQRRWTLHVLAQFSGAWSIPRPGFQAQAPDGRIHTSSAPELILQIGTSSNPPRLAEPSLAWTYADSQDAGIHGQRWWYALLAILVILVVLLFVLRRKHEEKPVDPFALFNQELKQAQTAQNYKESAARLSHALRAYCSHVWAFDGLGATNREMRRYLQTHLAPEELRSVCAILDSIEDIRWAPDHENQEVIQRCLVDAHTWCSKQERQRQERIAAEQTTGAAQS